MAGAILPWDITNPASPQLLWEFTNTNLGYTYGNPVITKQGNTWVVAVAFQGYNDVSPGDGVGRLYLLNANSGNLLATVGAGVGNTSTPSGWHDQCLDRQRQRK